MSQNVEQVIALCASGARVSSAKLRAAALRELNSGGDAKAACERVRALAEAAKHGRTSGRDVDLLRG